jgi:hypothetical protein
LGVDDLGVDDLCSAAVVTGVAAAGLVKTWTAAGLVTWTAAGLVTWTAAGLVTWTAAGLVTGTISSTCSIRLENGVPGMVSSTGAGLGAADPDGV